MTHNPLLFHVLILLMMNFSEVFNATYSHFIHFIHSIITLFTLFTLLLLFITQTTRSDIQVFRIQLLGLMNNPELYVHSNSQLLYLGSDMCHLQLTGYKDTDHNMAARSSLNFWQQLVTGCISLRILPGILSEFFWCFAAQTNEAVTASCIQYMSPDVTFSKAVVQCFDSDTSSRSPPTYRALFLWHVLTGEQLYIGSVEKHWRLLVLRCSGSHHYCFIYYSQNFSTEISQLLWSNLQVTCQSTSCLTRVASY